MDQEILNSPLSLSIFKAKMLTCLYRASQSSFRANTFSWALLAHSFSSGSCPCSSVGLWKPGTGSRVEHPTIPVISLCPSLCTSREDLLSKSWSRLEDDFSEELWVLSVPSLSTSEAAGMSASTLGYWHCCLRGLTHSFAAAQVIWGVGAAGFERWQGFQAQEPLQAALAASSAPRALCWQHRLAWAPTAAHCCCTLWSPSTHIPQPNVFYLSDELRVNLGSSTPTSERNSVIFTKKGDSPASISNGHLYSLPVLDR